MPGNPRVFGVTEPASHTARPIGHSWDTECYPLLPRAVGHREGTHPVGRERQAARRDENVAVRVDADGHDAGALCRLDVGAPADLAARGPVLLGELADDALRPRAHGGGHLVQVAADRHDAAIDARQDAAVARRVVLGYGMLFGDFPDCCGVGEVPKLNAVFEY